MRKAAVISVCLLGAALLAGCGPEEAIYVTDARKANGLVVILPGIEGESGMNHDIRDGLLQGGAAEALVIRPWGVPVPGLGLLVNQTNFLGNRMAGAGVARMIAEYQNVHPGAPVYLVGHSGGGGVAVFAAVAVADMDANRRVDGLILLSASISSDYDLTKALGCSRNGLVNFYNPEDVLLLGGGTALLGNVDGGHGPSAGLAGFQRDVPRLYQVEVGGGGDPHATATRVPFVAANVAPWIRSAAWPAMPAGAGRGRKDTEKREGRHGEKQKPASSSRPRDVTSRVSASSFSVSPLSASLFSASFSPALACGSRLNYPMFPVPYSLFPVP